MVPLRLLIVHIFKTKLERFDTTEILNYNTLQYTLPYPRNAVSHYSDGYSGLYGGATLVTAYRGTAIAALHYSGTAVRGGLLHRWVVRTNKVTSTYNSLVFLLSREGKQQKKHTNFARGSQGFRQREG